MYFDNQICINQKFHPAQNSKIRETQMLQQKRVSWLQATNKKTESPFKLGPFCKACEMLFQNWNKKS